MKKTTYQLFQTKNIIYFIFIILFFVLFSFISKSFFTKNLSQETEIIVYSTNDYPNFIKTFEKKLTNPNYFKWLANQFLLHRNIKEGRYVFTTDNSNFDIIKTLISGKQTPIDFTFNNIHSVKKLCDLLGEKLKANSSTFFNSFSEPLFMKKFELNNETLLTFFIPNTYEFYWNINIENLKKKFILAYSRFWNKKRKDKLKEIKLNRKEAYILASIVQKESNHIDEKLIIARLYLNRLEKNIRLQSDPTIRYILLKKNSKINRVLLKDPQIDSPFNTYRNNGLPPAPICMPDISSIDAVLFNEKNNFIYMCADPNNLGKHLFTDSYEIHKKNAKNYQKWLNKQNIVR